MGIHGLAKLIADQAPTAIKEQDIKTFFGELVYHLDVWSLFDVFLVLFSCTGFKYTVSLLLFSFLVSFDLCFFVYVRAQDCYRRVYVHLPISDRSQTRWKRFAEWRWWNNKVIVLYLSVSFCTILYIRTVSSVD